jgi:hypothetical protein
MPYSEYVVFTYEEANGGINFYSLKTPSYQNLLKQLGQVMVENIITIEEVTR